MKTFRRGSIRRDRAAAACLLTFPGFSPGCSCGPVARRPRGPREPMAPMPACPTGCGLIRSMSAHRARPVPGMPSAVTSPQAAPTALAAARARTEAHPTRGARDTTDLVRSFRGGVRAVLAGGGLGPAAGRRGGSAWRRAQPSPRDLRRPPRRCRGGSLRRHSAADLIGRVSTARCASRSTMLLERRIDEGLRPRGSGTEFGRTGWTVTGIHGGTGLRACCGRLFGRLACPTGRGGGNSDRT